MWRSSANSEREVGLRSFHLWVLEKSKTIKSSRVLLNLKPSNSPIQSDVFVNQLNAASESASHDLASAVDRYCFHKHTISTAPGRSFQYPGFFLKMYYLLQCINFYKRRLGRSGRVSSFLKELGTQFYVHVWKFCF